MAGKEIMELLNNQLKQIANISAETDKKLSNFLSTQLNTQSSIMQLSDKLSKDGVIDSRTKKNIQNIEKNIKELISSTKK